MLNYLFPRLLTPARRRWAYALVEVASIAVFAVAASVAIGYRLRNDNTMVRITGMCFVAVSAGLFVVATCLKRIDKNE